MKKNRDKKINEQQARPAPEEVILKETNIPSAEETEKRLTDNGEEQVLKQPHEQTAPELPEDTGEKTNDTPIEKKTAVFDGDGWRATVKKFFTEYPLAKNFASQIGKEIADDAALHTDANCLEKALLRVLCREYVAPEKLAEDDGFLQNYVLTNQAVKQAIIDEYLDNLQKSAPVRAIASGGQITLTPPSRPKSIEEAGAVIRTMLNNRRI